MQNNTFGGYRTADQYVTAKLKKFNAMEHSFENMFELMFSERENILYEKSRGYKIEYISYGEAYDRVISCAAAIKSRTAELAPDSVVGLYMDNDIDWIVCFWSILAAGFKPLLINSRLSEAIICRSIGDAGAKLVISDGKTLEGFEVIDFAELKNGADQESSALCFGSEILVMSSGTTAAPKLCAYSAEEFYYQINDSYNIITKCEQIKKHYEGRLKLLTFLPFYHVFGLIAVYIWFAFFSRTFVHLADFSAQTILNTIRRHKVTHIFAVPMFWNEVYRQAIKTIKDRGEDTYQTFLKGMAAAEKLCDVPVLGQAFIKTAFREIRDNLFGDSICFMITGGSEIKKEVLSFFNLIGYHLSNGYGMSEIGISSVELSTKISVRNEGFVGKPMSSVEYSIGDDGILSVRGKSTAKYVMENGKTVGKNDWFVTGDLAECVDGHYRILGRRDDLVISENGENLNPCLIEPLLFTESVHELCLIGTEDGGKTLPTLLVWAGRHITSEKHEAVRSELIRFLQEHNLSSQIRRIVFTAQPLTSGDDIKINRSKLSRLYADGKLQLVDTDAISSAAETDDELMGYIRELFSAAFDKPISEIGQDTDFFLDEGGSSLDYFAMISKIQEDHGVSFPATQDRTLSTVRELYEFVEAARKDVD